MEDEYINPLFYNKEFLFGPLLNNYIQWVVRMADRDVKNYMEEQSSQVVYFISPYRESWRLKSDRSSKILLTRIGFLQMMVYHRHYKDRITEMCEGFYKKNKHVSGGAACTYFLSLCMMWEYYMNREGGELKQEKLEFYKNLIVHYMEESFRQAIWEIEFQEFECGNISNPENLPDLRRQQKVWNLLNSEIIQPCLEYDVPF